MSKAKMYNSAPVQVTADVSWGSFMSCFQLLEFCTTVLEPWWQWLLYHCPGAMMTVVTVPLSWSHSDSGYCTTVLESWWHSGNCTTALEPWWHRLLYHCPGAMVSQWLLYLPAKQWSELILSTSRIIFSNSAALNWRMATRHLRERRMRGKRAGHLTSCCGI